MADDEFEGTGIDDNSDEQTTSLKNLFSAASNHVVTSIASTLSQNDLLYLYGRYKQASEGPCRSLRPGMFDFKGKQKWDAWEALGDKSSDECMQEYIDKVRALSKDWANSTASVDAKSADTGGSVGVGGVYVSRLAGTEEDTDRKADEDKTVFDWVIDGDINRVKQMLDSQQHHIDVDGKDEQGMSLLHWAADRGCKEIVELLITEYDADVNIRDDDQQTPLHYACSCEYSDVVEVLMFHGADPELTCTDGLVPAQHTKNEEILRLMGR